jgi:hypothetical protein
VKSTTPRYVLLAIVMIVLSIPQSGASAGGGNPDSILSGTYASIFSGWSTTNTFPQPFAGTGLFISDGKGNLSGHESVNFNGHACDYQIKGTYTIAADGSGSNAIKYMKGGTGCQNGSYTQKLTVAARGDMILLSNTNFPDVATEHWYRVRKPRLGIGGVGACYTANGCIMTGERSCFEMGGTYDGDGTTCD